MAEKSREKKTTDNRQKKHEQQTRIYIIFLYLLKGLNILDSVEM